MNKKQIAILCTLAVVLVAGWLLYSPSEPVSTPVDDATAAAEALAAQIDPAKVRPGDYTMGNPQAKVVVVEYASPSCTSCGYWNNLVKERFKQAYIDTGKVLFVYRFFLIQRFPHDPVVAKMAMCLPREQFFPFIDMMYRKQTEWDQAEYPEIKDPEAALLRLGRTAGLSEERITQCRAPNPAVDSDINAAAMAGEKAYAIAGTPTFIVNGQVSSMDFDLLSADIEAALAK